MAPESINKQSLKNGINRLLDDKVQGICRATIQGFGHGDWQVIDEALYDWEQRGFLQIVKDPHTAEPSDICIWMLAYIESTSPWPDWPSPDSKPPPDL